MTTHLTFITFSFPSLLSSSWLVFYHVVQRRVLFEVVSMEPTRGTMVKKVFKRLGLPFVDGDVPPKLAAQTPFLFVQPRLRTSTRTRT
jgi:hypothetical protein